MIESWTMKRLAAVTNGQLSGADVSFNQISTDTRTLVAGDLFVALKGPNFDGRQFLGQAHDKGAVGALISGAVSAVDFPQVTVSDTLKALRMMAAENRKSFHGPVCAVTGSSGKTTVKEMLASILSLSRSVFFTRGNLNNHIGVPLSLLQIDATHDAAVLELGASAQGEILLNTHLVKPDVAVITNAGEAHLAGFGSRDAIVQAKGELLDGLTERGCAVLNLDDPAFGVWNSMVLSSRVFCFSASGNAHADIFASGVELAPASCRFTIHLAGDQIRVNLPVAGGHNVSNALAASAAAWVQGIPLDQIARGLEQFSGVGARLQFRMLDGIRLIDDSYNANPSSMSAALDVLARQPGYRIAVLGDMAELGEDAAMLHEQVGGHAKSVGLDAVLSVGEFADHLARGAGSIGQALAEKNQLVEQLFELVGRHADPVILFKGSRSAKMEEVIRLLEEKLTGATC